MQKKDIMKIEPGTRMVVKRRRWKSSTRSIREVVFVEAACVGRNAYDSSYVPNSEGKRHLFAERYRADEWWSPCLVESRDVEMSYSEHQEQKAQAKALADAYRAKLEQREDEGHQRLFSAMLKRLMLKPYDVAMPPRVRFGSGDDGVAYSTTHNRVTLTVGSVRCSVDITDAFTFEDAAAVFADILCGLAHRGILCGVEGGIGA